MEKPHKEMCLDIQQWSTCPAYFPTVLCRLEMKFWREFLRLELAYPFPNKSNLLLLNFSPSIIHIGNKQLTTHAD